MYEGEKMNFDSLQVLKGAKLTYMGRSANMVEIIFDKCGNSYVIHAECFTRLYKNSVLFLTSDDITYPREQPLSWEEFDWDDMGDPFEKIGISLYDKKVEEVMSNLKSEKLTVRDVIVDSIGNITILINRDLMIQIFIDNTIDKDNWYFFILNKPDDSCLVHDGYTHYL